MKGSLHTDELMRSVTAKATGLRTDRRISHVFAIDVPGYAQTLWITDAAINIFPDLDRKRDIVQNAIDLYAGIGLGEPRVANPVRGRNGHFQDSLDHRGRRAVQDGRSRPDYGRIA